MIDQVYNKLNRVNDFYSALNGDDGWDFSGLEGNWPVLVTEQCTGSGGRLDFESINFFHCTFAAHSIHITAISVLWRTGWLNLNLSNIHGTNL